MFGVRMTSERCFVEDVHRITRAAARPANQEELQIIACVIVDVDVASARVGPTSSIVARLIRVEASLAEQ